MANKVVGSNCLALFVFVICVCLFLCDHAIEAETVTEKPITLHRIYCDGQVHYSNSHCNKFTRAFRNRVSDEVNNDHKLVNMVMEDRPLLHKIMSDATLAEDLRRDPSRFDRTTGEFEYTNRKAICARESKNMKAECKDDNACKDNCMKKNHAMDGACENYVQRRQITGTILSRSKRCRCYFAC